MSSKLPLNLNDLLRQRIEIKWQQAHPAHRTKERNRRGRTGGEPVASIE